MSESEEKIVVPGEEVGTSEEYLPGEGTYEMDGKIMASRVGVVEYDEDDMTVSTRPLNPVVEVKRGDVVIAEVVMVRDTMVVVDIKKVEGKDRSITGDTSGTIHVSKASQAYVKDLKKEFKIGDYVRAKVMQAKPSIQLTTAYPEYGVIKALCSKCRGPMVRKGTMVYCPNCERTETRKISSMYGKIRSI